MFSVMRKTTLSLLVMVLLLVYTKSAYAYLDPGSGSLVLQVLLGGVAAVTLVLKLFWHRILTLLGLRKKDIPEP